MRFTLVCVALLALNAFLTAQVEERFNGVAYVFPSSQGDANEVLTAADANGTLAWDAAPDATWPPNMVVFSPTGSCPSGWSEYTAARGRYVVGLVSGGSSGNTPGTALTNMENRAVGQHNHTVSDSGHTHTQNAHSHAVFDPGHSHTNAPTQQNISLDGTWVNPAGIRSGNANTGSATTNAAVANATATNISAVTGATLANAGSVAGTNAPYIQLIACQSPAS